MNVRWLQELHWDTSWVNRKQENGLRLAGRQICEFCQASVKARGFNRHVRRLHFVGVVAGRGGVGAAIHGNRAA